MTITVPVHVAQADCHGAAGHARRRRFHCELLRQARMRANVSVHTAALAVRRTDPTIVSYEEGTTTPSISLLLQLVELYGVGLDDVLRDVPTELCACGKPAIAIDEKDLITADLVDRLLTVPQMDGYDPRAVRDLIDQIPPEHHGVVIERVVREWATVAEIAGRLGAIVEGLAGRMRMAIEMSLETSRAASAIADELSAALPSDEVTAVARRSSPSRLRTQVRRQRKTKGVGAAS